MVSEFPADPPVNLAGAFLDCCLLSIGHCDAMAVWCERSGDEALLVVKGVPRRAGDRTREDLSVQAPVALGLLLMVVSWNLQPHSLGCLMWLVVGMLASGGRVLHLENRTPKRLYWAVPAQAEASVTSVVECLQVPADDDRLINALARIESRLITVLDALVAEPNGLDVAAAELEALGFQAQKVHAKAARLNEAKAALERSTGNASLAATLSGTSELARLDDDLAGVDAEAHALEAAAADVAALDAARAPDSVL